MLQPASFESASEQQSDTSQQDRVMYIHMSSILYKTNQGLLIWSGQQPASKNHLQYIQSLATSKLLTMFILQENGTVQRYASASCV